MLNRALEEAYATSTLSSITSVRHDQQVTEKAAVVDKQNISQVVLVFHKFCSSKEIVLTNTNTRTCQLPNLYVFEKISQIYR